MSVQSPPLERTLQVLLLFIFGIAALYFAKPFLVPVCIAGMLAMLLLPLSSKLELAGFNRGLSSFFCVLLLMLIIAGIIALIAWQVSNLTEEIGNVQSKIKGAWQQLSGYISERFGITRKQQEEVIEKQSEDGAGGIASLGMSLMNVVVNFILTMVYIFLFLYFRSRIRNFVLQLVPKKDDDITEHAIDRIKKVAQQYVTGLSMMIVCLWIMYSIAFSLLGLKFAIFFAILCGVFEIVPFIGNLLGNTLAVLMAITQGGGMSMVLGIIGVYALIQFLQTYLLEPLVVGTGVSINPLFTIIALVVGELVWGIPGLVLAIPLMGITKIVCDHIPALQPYGYLIGHDKPAKSGFIDKIKAKFSKKGDSDKKAKK